MITISSLSLFTFSVLNRVYQNVTKHISICVCLLSQGSKGRYNLLSDRLRLKLKREAKESRNSPKMTETEQALEFIIKHEDSTEQAHKETSEKAKQKYQKKVGKRQWRSWEQHIRGNVERKAGRKRGAQWK